MQLPKCCRRRILKSTSCPAASLHHRLPGDEGFAICSWIAESVLEPTGSMLLVPHVFQYLKQRTCRLQAALGRLRPGELVTHRFKLADVEHAYDVFERSAETGAIKVVIDMA